MSLWVIRSRASFTARHALTRYRGVPEEPHEHLWQVELRVGTLKLNDEGYAIDFHAVHELLGRAVASLDGTDLGRHPEIGSPSPTAERVARVMADTLRGRVAELGGRLLSVSVWEGPDNRVDLELDE